MHIATFDAGYWAAVPFHFWLLVFFVLGCIVGSFLNVCIHRLPLGMSIVTPPSHCPHCKYSIPWWLNIPLVTWLVLKGRCKNCGAPISPRYFVVELLTGIAFLACWLEFGNSLHPYPSMPIALVYAVLLAGLICATFIDFEHFIIPDEITFGGVAAGIIASFFLPQLHEVRSHGAGILWGAVGALAGAGIVYAFSRLGKLLFGKYALNLDAESRVIFTESAILLPPKRLSLDQLYQRSSGWFAFQAEKVELMDRCCMKVVVGISASKIRIGEEVFDRMTIPHFEAFVERLLSPHQTARLAGVRWGFFQFLADWIGSLFEQMSRRQKINILPGSHLVFTPTNAWLYRKDMVFQDGEIFYRKTDAISFYAREVEAQFGSWRNVSVHLTPLTLKIGEVEYNPEAVPRMEVVTDRMVLPREAMGLGDVKFMAAIGAFLGWPGAVFALFASAPIGLAVYVPLILLKRRDWSSRMPYGPYIALAAALWVFNAFNGRQFFLDFLQMLTTGPGS